MCTMFWKRIQWTGPFNALRAQAKCVHPSTCTLCENSVRNKNPKSLYEGHAITGSEWRWEDYQGLWQKVKLPVEKGARCECTGKANACRIAYYSLAHITVRVCVCGGGVCVCASVQCMYRVHNGLPLHKTSYGTRCIEDHSYASLGHYMWLYAHVLTNAQLTDYTRNCNIFHASEYVRYAVVVIDSTLSSQRWSFVYHVSDWAIRM